MESTDAVVVNDKPELGGQTRIELGDYNPVISELPGRPVGRYGQ